MRKKSGITNEVQAIMLVSDFEKDVCNWEQLLGLRD